MAEKDPYEDMVQTGEVFHTKSDAPWYKRLGWWIRDTVRGFFGYAKNLISRMAQDPVIVITGLTTGVLFVLFPEARLAILGMVFYAMFILAVFRFFMIGFSV